jgi:hypothetical protein
VLKTTKPFLEQSVVCISFSCNLNTSKFFFAIPTLEKKNMGMMSSYLFSLNTTTTCQFSKHILVKHTPREQHLPVYITHQSIALPHNTPRFSFFQFCYVRNLADFSAIEAKLD